MERRQHRRYVRRVLVSFWMDGNPREHKGYTTNVSLTGMFVASTHLPSRGDRVRIEIADRGVASRCEGVVVRVKQVPIELRRVQPAGFGVRFTANSDAIRSLLPDDEATSPEAATVALCAKVTFDTVARFIDAFRREIRTGSMIVSVPGTPSVGDHLLVDLIPPATLGRSVRCSARITHVARGAVTVEFEDVNEVLTELKTHVERALRG
jgi:hypothetical protein